MSKYADRSLRWATAESRRQLDRYWLIVKLTVALVLFMIPMVWLILSGLSAVVVAMALVIAIVVLVPTSGRGRAQPLPPALPIVGEVQDFLEELPASARFGPNAARVAGFLRALRKMDALHWQLVEKDFDPPSSPVHLVWRITRFNRAWRHVTAVAQSGEREPELEALFIIIDELVEEAVVPFTPPHYAFWAARQAGAALVLEDLLPDTSVATLYRPFNALIPLSTLPEG